MIAAALLALGLWPLWTDEFPFVLMWIFLGVVFADAIAMVILSNTVCKKQK